jgi:phosphonate transport system substrate-binding protein
MQRSIIKLLAVLTVLAAGLPAALAQGGELIFGVYPYLTPTQIVETFTPLKEHIARTLGRPVAMVSAADFPTFIERTRKGEYDIIFTAPHMGRLAEKRDGYGRVAQTGYQITATVVARKDGNINSLDDLRGRKIAVGSRDSMTHQIIEKDLYKKGMLLGREVQFVETSFSNLTQAVLRKEVDAGVTGKSVYESASEELRRDLKVIYQAAPAPGFLVMAHSRLGDASLRRLQGALATFKDTTEGAAYFKKVPQVDFRPIDEATMKRIDPFVAVLIQPR